MSEPNRHRAKAVILELLRQAGGTLPTKVSLFKGFWMAHVQYARQHMRPLSDWPIVRMPRGPGIGDFKSLEASMIMDSELATTDVVIGGMDATAYSLGDEPVSCDLPVDAKEAIGKAVKWIHGKSARQLSEESHSISWQWHELEDGDVMDVFMDLIPSAMNDRVRARATAIVAHFS